MARVYHHEHEGRGMQPYPYQQHPYSNEPMAHQVVKGVTSALAGGSLLVLSGLTLAATVIGLTVATPLLVIFSPVLVPAVITVFLLVTGFLTSGGLGVAATMVLSWIYSYVTGGRPRGSDSLDEATDKMGWKGREMRERGEHGIAGRHDREGGHYQP
ncbi:oleosin 1-like [Cynara cardunculus var. scolymus]|uniref:oleosin 1-like n=1 Tax=Cynara cardunculus var. scolymus TaxID=59895 RepID=UPI000D62F934|nr:oleosin 1-like [Cynara cardunculus var. scolymus]